MLKFLFFSVSLLLKSGNVQSKSLDWSFEFSPVNFPQTLSNKNYWVESSQTLIWKPPCVSLSWQHYPAVSGAFMDSPYNGNTSLQTSTSNLNAGYSRPSEAEDDGKVSSDTIWLWIAVLATIGNIVVVAVVCACAFWKDRRVEQKYCHCLIMGNLVQPKNIFFFKNNVK